MAQLDDRPARQRDTQLRTIRGRWLLLVAAQVIIAGISAMMTGADPNQATTTNMALGAPTGMVSLFTLVLGITAIAGEHRHRTITSTYLANPRRHRVIGAKLAVYTGAVRLAEWDASNSMHTCGHGSPSTPQRTGGRVAGERQRRR